ncbi:thymidylate synthase [Mesorhizobium sp. IMUNJ 23033]|uniref:thymidylate synthase n=1 Tax=Mesorhizobium sp. IMUNJ 23033 TaxID=3378039 RepID=UPI00384E409D
MNIRGDSLDDLLRSVYRRIVRDGMNISPRKGDAREIIGAKLTLTNPRARFSRAESRSILFSCLGEFTWILSGSESLSQIAYYISRYRELSNDGLILRGAYGPRIFGGGANSQFNQIARALSRNTDSRQNVIQIFDPEDLADDNLDVPCTCTMQFFKRQNRLHMMVSMRSNDAFIGMPHDIFCFTMLQEIMTRRIGCELGEYHHVAGSLHLYDADRGKAQQYLGESVQSRLAMPAMPIGDPTEAVARLVELERLYRTGAVEDFTVDGLEPYWADLARLLMAKRLFVEHRRGAMRQIRSEMHSPVYDAYIRGEHDRLAAREARRAAQMQLPNLELVVGADDEAK